MGNGESFITRDAGMRSTNNNNNNNNVLFNLAEVKAIRPSLSFNQEKKIQIE